jgi:hypothetical protein
MHAAKQIIQCRGHDLGADFASFLPPSASIQVSDPSIDRQMMATVADILMEPTTREIRSTVVLITNL